MAEKTAETQVHLRQDNQSRGRGMILINVKIRLKE